MPTLVAQDKSLAESVGSVHGALAWALLGALYHALVKQDGVVQRMVPGRG